MSLCHRHLPLGQLRLRRVAQQLRHRSLYRPGRFALGLPSVAAGGAGWGVVTSDRKFSVSRHAVIVSTATNR